MSAKWLCHRHRSKRTAAASHVNVPSVAGEFQHVNRIVGLLAGQESPAYYPLHKDRRTRLDGLTTGDGRPLPSRLKAVLLRELARIELLLLQIADFEGLNVMPPLSRMRKDGRRRSRCSRSSRQSVRRLARRFIM